jgi:hypothetical protein
MSRGPIDLWTRTPRSIAPFSASAPSHHDPSSADFITNIAESDFRYRHLVWINVTPHPTADWIARQITEAFPWNEAPRYLIRDRDQVYGVAVRHRLRAMGIRDKPIAPRSP